MDSVGGGGISDVFNSDYQGDFPFEFSNAIVSPNELQTAELSNASFGRFDLRTSSSSCKSFNFLGNIGSQAGSDTVGGWPDDVNPTQGFGLELPLSSTIRENVLTDASNLLRVSTSSQSAQLVVKDIKAADQSAPKTTSRASIRKASSSESSSDNTTPSQIWVCDFQDCGRLFESHKKLQ